jgi:hypothetical protein
MSEKNRQRRSKRSYWNVPVSLENAFCSFGEKKWSLGEKGCHLEKIIAILEKIMYRIPTIQYAKLLAF